MPHPRAGALSRIKKKKKGKKASSPSASGAPSPRQDTIAPPLPPPPDKPHHAVLLPPQRGTSNSPSPLDSRGADGRSIRSDLFLLVRDFVASARVFPSLLEHAVRSVTRLLSAQVASDLPAARR